MPLHAASASGSSRRGRRWLLLLLSAATGVSGYGAYRFYLLPSVARRRWELARLVRALISVANSASASAEAVGLVSADLNHFLRSDSEAVPTSLHQLAKLARSEDFSALIFKSCEAVTAGIVRGISSAETSVAKSESLESGSRVSSSTFLLDRFLDKLFSGAGSGFAAAVVGSFARNLASTYTEASGRSDEERFPRWVLRICDDTECRELVVDSIARAVSGAVAMYLDRTMRTNARDEFLSNLANPKHEAKTKDILVSVCNGAVATLVKTSQEVMTADSTPWEEKHRPKKCGGDEFVPGVVSSTLAIPSNRRLLVDVTGRVAVETMRSFLDFLQWKLRAAARRGVDVIHEEAMEMVRFAGAKAMVVVGLCLALCMQISIGPKFMVA